MDAGRKKRIAVTVLITSVISVTVCFFCFERIHEIIFFGFLLDLFLLAMVTIFSGAMVSLRVRRMLEDKMKELEDKGNDQAEGLPTDKQ